MAVSSKDFKDVELRDYEYRVLYEGVHKLNDNLLTIYGFDQHKAGIFYRMNLNVFKYAFNYKLLFYQRPNGDKNLVLYRKRFGISKNNKKYSSETILSRVILSKGRFYYKSVNNKSILFKHLTLNNFYTFFSVLRNMEDSSIFRTVLNEEIDYNSLFNLFFADYTWVRFLNEDREKFGTLSLNTIKNKRLYNRKDVIRHFSGLDYPTFELVKDFYKDKDFYGAGGLFGYCKYIKGLVNNPQNLTPEIMSSEYFMDTLKMAETLGYKVNGSWGLKRLKAEHDRYSREITDFNFEYSPVKDLNILPIYLKFADYSGIDLLRTNKEMFLEGKKMNHCVASYVNSVESGQSAIYHYRDFTIELNYLLNGKYEYNLNNGYCIVTEGWRYKIDTSQLNNNYAIYVNDGVVEFKDRNRTSVEVVRHNLIPQQVRGFNNNHPSLEIMDEIISKLEDFNNFINDLSVDELKDYLCIADGENNAIISEVKDIMEGVLIDL